MAHAQRVDKGRRATPPAPERSPPHRQEEATAQRGIPDPRGSARLQTDPRGPRTPGTRPLRGSGAVAVSRSEARPGETAAPPPRPLTRGTHATPPPLAAPRRTAGQGPGPPLSAEDARAPPELGAGQGTAGRAHGISGTRSAWGPRTVCERRSGAPRGGRPGPGVPSVGRHEPLGHEDQGLGPREHRAGASSWGVKDGRFD